MTFRRTATTPNPSMDADVEYRLEAVHGPVRTAAVRPPSTTPGWGRLHLLAADQPVNSWSHDSTTSVCHVANYFKVRRSFSACTVAGGTRCRQCPFRASTGCPTGTRTDAVFNKDIFATLLTSVINPTEFCEPRLLTSGRSSRSMHSCRSYNEAA